MTERYSWADAFNRKEPANPEPIAPVIPITAGSTAGSADSRYGAKALADEAALVAAAPEGSRNDQLNRAAFNLAQLVASGHLAYADVRDQLLAAAHTCGLTRAEAEKTIGSGFRSGSRQPRDVQPLPEIQARVLDVSREEIAPHIGDGDQDATQGADGQEHADERRRSSWWAKPLAGLVDEAQAEPEPDLLVRGDGAGLAYRGKINGLIGESESGKTWVALHAAHQHAAGGGHVLILDFEDTPSTTHTRLVALGCTDETLSRIAYANPDQGLDVLASADLTEHRDHARPSLVVIDGVNAAMTLMGLDLNSNTDATLFHTRLLKPMTAAGAGVLTVDHVPKNAEQRGKGGIGAQAKRAMISGSSIRVEVSEPFGKGQSGKLKLWVDKDRPGHVRGHSGNGKYAGTFTLESNMNGIRAEINPPNLDPTEPWRPTVMMGRISRLLQAGPMSVRGIREAIDGRAETVREALQRLVDDGYVAQSPGARGSVMNRNIKPFDESVSEVETNEL